MSLLAPTTGRALALARASTTAHTTPTAVASTSRGVTVLFESRRYASRRRAMARSARGKATIQRDAMGKPIPVKKERTPPLFTALPVDQLKENPLFEVELRETAEDEKLPVFSSKTVNTDHSGEALQFPMSPEAVEARKQFGLPKTIWKEFKLLPRPASVVRDVTLDVVNLLNSVQKDSGKPSNDARVVLGGRTGSGKSYLLLQAVEWCLDNGWIVLYIPRAVNLVNSTTPYTYDLRTQTFLQPEASHQLLHRFRHINAKPLKKLKLEKALTAEGFKVVPAGTSLYDLCDVPREEVARAPMVLDVVMKVLEGQTSSPVLLAIDDFQSLFSRSSYRDPHFKPIATYHLSLPRLLLEFTSGRRSFSKGAFLGALTSSDPNFPISLAVHDMLERNVDVVRKPIVEEPYVKRSSVLKGYLEGVGCVNVPNGLSVKEAGSVFEVWMKQGVLASQAHDELFMAKYVESGGNPRDFVWKGLLRTLQT